jgi:sugar/nucleoside kinase (ribokinase family)
VTEEQRRYDVVGIGNAIVDVLGHADESFIEKEGLPKGGMTLLNEEQANALYARSGPGTECSGGSAANTIAGIAALGGRTAFIGRVHKDQLGDVFTHDIRSLGVSFHTPPSDDGPSTARCLIFVTPDAERTMGTYLGASQGLTPQDIDRDLIKNAQVTYLEGYLWDPPKAKEAFLVAMDIAHAAGNKVALSLSDPFCVDRYRVEFRSLAEQHIDILFANEEELKSLYETDDFDTALQHVRGHCEIAALTRSEKGSVIVSGNEVHVIDAAPVNKVVDTTGAGDLYAAGFLYGLTHGMSLRDCGVLGGKSAAEVISHMGARPEQDLKDLLISAG